MQVKSGVKALKCASHATRSAHFTSPDLIMWRLNFIQIRLQVQVLGAFIKLRKVTVTFAMSVRPPVRMEQLHSLVGFS